MLPVVNTCIMKWCTNITQFIKKIILYLNKYKPYHSLYKIEQELPMLELYDLTISKLHTVCTELYFTLKCTSLWDLLPTLCKYNVWVYLPTTQYCNSRKWWLLTARYFLEQDYSTELIKFIHRQMVNIFISHT